jgi:nitric oxide reductase NorQ protein
MNDPIAPLPADHDIVPPARPTATAPYYEPQGREVEIFEAAYGKRLPVMLKGPTGCGKTRFLEHMAWRLNRPLVTVSCHEDLTSSDLVGRFLLEGSETVWQDGPLTRAVKAGAICYLDEIVEARTDSTVIIHPLTDHRRRLSLEKIGREITAHEDFLLVISYNPGYQTVLKDLKPSTKQRFIGLNFDFPAEETERRILVNEVPGLDADSAARRDRHHGAGTGGNGDRHLLHAAPAPPPRRPRSRGGQDQPRPAQHPPLGTVALGPGGDAG